MEYKPQLDALRAIAVSGVLYTHFVDGYSWWGSLGVRLFFVLSGFLITSILLKDGLTFSFYARRAARLWPILYLTLAAGLVLDLPGLRATWAWHAAQLSNLFFFLEHSFSSVRVAAHLWTLNVEEQFYLVWPLIIGLTPRRALVPLLVVVAAIGPAYRFAVHDEFANLLPAASLDALAAGALLALVPSRHVYLLGLAAAPLVVLAFYTGAMWLVLLASVPPFCALVLAGARGHLRLIEQSWLIWLGKISYGIYLLHLFVLETMIKFGWDGGYGRKTLIVGSALTIALAAASYTWFERPFRERVARRFKPVQRLPATTP
jgi:peptidoglycan/LPS O-acetylase OafA/YrhL